MDPASMQEAKYKTQSILGIINDTIEVGIAKLRFEDHTPLDVAIIKATRQDETPPKEKHILTLVQGCEASMPREQVAYIIQGLLKRLEENSKAWLVTLKTLITFHRLMREAGVTFIEELLSYGERTGHHHALRLESFADHTTKETWDYSAWIRFYSVYLDERLAIFRALRLAPGQDKESEPAKEGADEEVQESKLTSYTFQELLEYLPQVQRLLGDLLSCAPTGASQTNDVTLNACSLVLKELRYVYDTQCKGVERVLAQLGEVDKADVAKGIKLVRDSVALNERMVAFEAVINGIPPLQRLIRFPDVQSVPADVLANLDEYLKDKPPPAPMTNLLGFQSFAVKEPAPDAAAAAPLASPTAGAPAAPTVPFDPFASFIGPRPVEEKGPVDPLDELIVPLTNQAAPAQAEGAAAADAGDPFAASPPPIVVAPAVPIAPPPPPPTAVTAAPAAGSAAQAPTTPVPSTGSPVPQAVSAAPPVAAPEPASAVQVAPQPSSAGATPVTSPMPFPTAPAPLVAVTSPVDGVNSPGGAVPAVVLPPPVTPVAAAAPPPPPAPAATPKYTLKEHDPLDKITVEIFGKTEPPPPVPMASMRVKGEGGQDAPSGSGAQE